jgi:RNA 2',3'-cyclic 3'-phosphodiesterase
MPRLFVAIRPPALICAHLMTLMNEVEGARWQDDEQLHLTLRFIGDVDARAGEDVVSALAAVHAAPFDIALHGVGSFAHKGHVDAVWAGVAPHPPLAQLHKKIDHALVRAGLPPEGRAYVPHITLARGHMTTPPDGFLAAHGGLRSEPFPVTHFALFESTLGSQGARYTVVERWALG